MNGKMRRARKQSMALRTLPPHTWEARPFTRSGEANKTLVSVIVSLVAIVVVILLLFVGSQFVGKAYQVAGGHEIDIKYLQDELLITATLQDSVRTGSVYFELTPITPRVQLCQFPVTSELWTDFRDVTCENNVLRFGSATLSDNNFRGGIVPLAQVRPLLPQGMTSFEVNLRQIDVYDAASGEDLFPSGQTFAFAIAPCQNGAVQACGIAMGQCRRGTQRCENGVFGACMNAIAPVPEICNQLDDDCDGQADEERTCVETCESDSVMVSLAGTQKLYEAKPILQKNDLPELLADGSVTNEKGTAPYTQQLSFQNTRSGYVGLMEDDDDVTDNFFYVQNDDPLATYRLFFAPALQSDIVDGNGMMVESGARFDDLIDLSVTMLGVPYTIVSAQRRLASTGLQANSVQLELLAHAVSDTLRSGETKNYVVAGRSYAVSLTFIDSDECNFRVNNEVTSNLMAEQSFVLSDRNEIRVKEIRSDNSDSIRSCTFYLGTDSLILRDDDIASSAATGSFPLRVGAEDIDGTSVIIDASILGTRYSLNSITISMKANDHYYVGRGQLLSDEITAAGEEREVLFTNNWDIRLNSYDSSTRASVVEIGKLCQVSQPTQCSLGSTRTCGTASTIGMCQSGRQTCGANGQWGLCLNQSNQPVILPNTRQETCDLLDNDCDGSVNEEGICGQLRIASAVFDNEGNIPDKYTCTGQNINPPLTITNIPPAARSLVLIADDPDANITRPVVHWAIINIPVPQNRVVDIREGGIAPGTVMPNEVGKRNAYNGPCPPTGMSHAYRFRVYALNISSISALTIQDRDTIIRAKAVEDNFANNIVDRVTLNGYYYPRAAVEENVREVPRGGGFGGCLSQWNCTATWTFCNATLQQGRSCTDVNRCDVRKLTKWENRTCTACEESWVCTAWNTCQGTRQTRQCSDEHRCGTLVAKPALEKSCVIAAPAGPEPARIQPQLPVTLPPSVQQPRPLPIPTPIDGPSFWQAYKALLFAVPAALLVIILVIVLVILHAHKKKMVYNYDDLKEWISQEKQMGTGKEDIKEILGQQTGWSMQEIEQAFAELADPDARNSVESEHRP